MDLTKHITTIPDYPKPGIMFRDVTSLMHNDAAFGVCIERMSEGCLNKNISKIVGIEARGFIFGAALAKHMGKGFVPIRKKGKLPRAVFSATYDLEYGTDTLELHQDALDPGDKVIVVDDLIATGGTAKAAGQLLERLGVDIVSFLFVIDLPDLGGAENLRTLGFPVSSLISFPGH
ncbi:MAG: adenine phosphoribosyltransferase [Alphaproteobacteria bacterium]